MLPAVCYQSAWVNLPCLSRTHACFDQNAWAFFQAFWAEPNPLQPKTPYPTAPGVFWMLGGMAVSDGMLQVGTEKEAEAVVMDSGSKIVRLSPHLMIMPLPVAEGDSLLQGKYDTDHHTRTGRCLPAPRLSI